MLSMGFLMKTTSEMNENDNFGATKICIHVMPNVMND